VLKQPATPYAQGYQKGYADGFAQGETDWSNNARPDFRRSDKWQQHDAGSSEEYRMVMSLDSSFLTADGYYGRARNAEVPRNAGSDRQSGQAFRSAAGQGVNAEIVTAPIMIAGNANLIGPDPSALLSVPKRY